MKMKKEIMFAAAVLAIIGLLVASRSLEDASFKPNRVRIATGGPSGVYFKYGEALAGIIGDRTKSDVTVIPSGGSVENVRLLRENRAELAFVQNDIMTYAYDGADIFSADGPFKDFSAVAGLYPEACQIVARSDVKDIHDLKSRKVSIGDKGSGTELNAIQILSAYGMSETDIDADNLSFGASVTALREGKIDAFFCTAGVPTPAVSELAASGEIRILGIGAAHIASITGRYPYYSRHTIPAGVYPNLSDEIETVAVRAALVASNRISADDVFVITKLLFENKDDIAAICEEANGLDRESAVNGIPIPLHAGAEKFYFGK
ncbi:MAG: TAXI family TRAP transporter solute-binding subunit [Synergistaceae bacterium]|jgi:TRAP transporter TAXI family solute receptor|nr:TAXI family TRAP transporter solute-binding subunit [Synergistaceae bacterium]